MKNVIVVFTIKDDNTNAFLNKFFPAQNWEDWKYKLFPDNNKFDLIFINDSCNSWTESDYNNLKNHISNNNIYIIFHREEKLVNEVFSVFTTFKTIQRHNSGWGFDLLCQLSTEIGNDKYKEIFNELVERIHNIQIELRLNVLHSCLTPCGTAAAKDAYDLVTLLDKDDEKQKIKKSFREFIEKINEETNCFSDNYIYELEKLRKSLLE